MKTADQQKNRRIRETDFYVGDISTRYNKPEIRLLLNFFAAMLLGRDFAHINSTYFSSVAMFALPILFEYLRFTPLENPRKVLKEIEVTLLALILLICALGFVDILKIVSFGSQPHIMVQKEFVIAGGFHFPASVLWNSVFLSFFLTAIDTFSAHRTAEKTCIEFKSPKR